MRAVIQRVSRASVTIGETERAAISAGLLVLVGIEEADDLCADLGAALERATQVCEQPTLEVAP